MKTSESIKEIAVVLPLAQAQIKTALKGAKNPHYNSKYSDLSTIIEACKEALNSNGITFLQPVRASERGVIVETILLHTSAEWISEELELPVTKQDAQGLGSAITYGKRYGLQSLIGIPSEDDDGNAAGAGQNGEKTKQNAADHTQTSTSKFGASGAETCAAEFARMTPEDQLSMRLHASIVLKSNPVEGAAYIKQQKFTNDEETALWSLLPSYKRSAVKKAQGFTPADLASQP